MNSVEEDKMCNRDNTDNTSSRLDKDDGGTVGHVDNMDKINKCVELLSENANIELVEVPKYRKIYGAYRYLKKIYEQMPEYHTHIADLINNQFRPTVLHIGTIGSFLFGCHQYYYGHISQACSPLCIGNLHSTQESCQYQIWVQQKNSDFILIGNTHSSHAYVFLNIPNYIFTTSDIQQFKDAGVEYLQLVRTHNSKHDYSSKLLPLSDIPISPSIPSSSPTFPQSLKLFIKSSSISTFIPLIILIILLLFFLLISFCLSF